MTLASLESLDPRTRGFDLLPPRSRKQDVESALGLDLLALGRAGERLRILEFATRHQLQLERLRDPGGLGARIGGLVGCPGERRARDRDFSGRGARLELLEIRVRLPDFGLRRLQVGKQRLIGQPRDQVAGPDAVALVHDNFVDDARDPRTHVGVLDREHAHRAGHPKFHAAEYQCEEGYPHGSRNHQAASLRPEAAGGAWLLLRLVPALRVGSGGRLVGIIVRRASSHETADTAAEPRSHHGAEQRERDRLAFPDQNPAGLHRHETQQ